MMLYVDPAPTMALIWSLWIAAFLLFRLIWGIVCAVIAKKKGRSGAWFFGGFFLGLIGLIIVLCLRKKRY